MYVIVYFQLAVYFNLVSLKDFDVQMNRFAVFGFLTASWTDERLAWQPLHHNAISSSIFYQGDIWTPGLVLWNPYTSIGKIGFEEVPVRLASNGLAKWNPGQVFETLCCADVTYFPFDTQRCTMDILLYGYTMDEINITIDKTFISRDPPTENTMWEVLDTSTYLDEIRNEQTFHICVTFKRRPMIFVVSIILPLSLMCLVNLSVFFIPAAEGNRIDFAITMVLTMSVSVTTVSGFLPQSSIPQIAYLCYLVAVHVCVSMFVMVFTIASVNIYHKNEAETKSIVTKYFTKLMGCRRQVRIRDVNEVDDINDEKDEKEPYQMKEAYQMKDCDLSWNDVGSAFDKFSFRFFLLLIVVFDVVIFILLISH